MEWVFQGAENPSHFDKSGVLYALGTSFGKGAYCNPIKRGVVEIRFSPDAGNFSSNSEGRLVDDKQRAAEVIASNEHPGEAATQWSVGAPGAWILVDLRGRLLAATHYCYRGGLINPTAWEIQGSTDGSSWTTLRKHENDHSVQKGAVGSWDLKPSLGAFSQFRILNRGPPSQLCCAGIELYGGAVSRPSPADVKPAPTPALASAEAAKQAGYEGGGGGASVAARLSSRRLSRSLGRAPAPASALPTGAQREAGGVEAPGDDAEGIESELADGRADVGSVASRLALVEGAIARDSAAERRQLAYYTDMTVAMSSDLCQVILRDHGYLRREKREEDWALYWRAGELRDAATVLGSLPPHARVNKIAGGFVLTDKCRLAQGFAAMRDAHGATFDFMPESFVLPEDAAEFEARLRQSFADGEACVWIMKPGNRCQGSGIFLHSPTSDAALGGWGAPSGGVYPPAVAKHVGVACRYIDPPYLLDGLKFDLRLYVLVTSVHPLVAYFYEEGLARFATEPYVFDERAARRGQSLERTCMHLTNVSVNKYSKGWAKNTSTAEDGVGSKWSLSALRKRLRAELGDARAEQAWRDVDDLVTKALLGAEPDLVAAEAEAMPGSAAGENGRSCFQLLGFDVMLDAAAKPWLLEINVDPQMSTDTPIDFKIKAELLIDTFNVVGMPMPPPRPENAGCTRKANAGANARRAPGQSEMMRAEYMPFLAPERRALNQLPFALACD